MTKEKKVSLTIDNRKVEAREGMTILQAAGKNGIYIPSLCAMEHLPSYGACRLCVVEVDGLRGFPTSCTTPVEEGMVIRTDTAEVRALRQEVLKLLLSEHPASCLFCEEQSDCKKYQGTIRKAGVTTGCRYCPNDDNCELQRITEKIGLTETSYPVYYRNFPVEKEDPFYDRDYNLCILCGRCVRVCNDIRYNGTLSFKQRGKLTTIGPAFSRSHIEAGCEFCGACVAVCPTGALAAKTSKWYGIPEHSIESTCPYCPIGCTIDLKVKAGEVVDAGADYDSPTEHGLICVKGRFAIPEYVMSPERLAEPTILRPEGYDLISWEGALDEAATRLRAAGPKGVFIVVSPQLSNEDLYTAQKFAREVIGTEAILSPVIFDLGDDIGPFLDLVLLSDTIESIDTADSILAVGLDTTYGFTPVGIAAKRAASRGSFLVTLNDGECNLEVLAEEVHRSEETKWPTFIDSIIKKTSGDGAGKKTQVGESRFRKDQQNILLLGPGAIFSQKRKDIFESAIKMRDRLGWKVIVCHPYTNLLGMLAVGAFPGISPGNFGPDGSVRIKQNMAAIDPGQGVKVGYFIGEVPSDNMPKFDYLIYQNALPSSAGPNPDLILPAGLFTEQPGTIVNCEGKILAFKEVAAPYEHSKPDWWIISGISARMKKGSRQYRSFVSVQKEMKKVVAVLADKNREIPRKKVFFEGKSAAGNRRFRPRPDGRTVVAAFRGVPLHDHVAGMKAIEEKGGVSE